MSQTYPLISLQKKGTKTESNLAQNNNVTKLQISSTLVILLPATISGLTSGLSNNSYLLCAIELWSFIHGRVDLTRILDICTLGHLSWVQWRERLYEG